MQTVDQVKKNAEWLYDYHEKGNLIKLFLYPYAYYLSHNHLKLLRSSEFKDYVFELCKEEDSDFIERHNVREVKFNHGFYFHSTIGGTYTLPDVDREYGYNDVLYLSASMKERFKAILCLIIIGLYLFFSFIGLYCVFLR